MTLWLAVALARATLCEEPGAGARRIFVSIGSDDW